MAFSRRCEIEVLSGQITGTLTDYRVLIYVTHNDLRTVGNGGYVEDAQGDDIRVFSDAALTSAVPFVREFYSPTTGFLIMHAKISSLAAGGKYYLGFGDAALTSDASDAANTFGTGYGIVMPFGDGTTLSMADIANANNGTNNGCTVSSAILGGGASCDGSDDYVSVPSFYPGASLAITFLMIPDVNDAIKALVMKRPNMTGESGGNENYAVYSWSSGEIRFFVSQNGSTLNFNLNGATAVSTGALNVVHCIFDGGSASARIYLNGVQDATSGAFAGAVHNGTGTPLHIGDDGTAGRFFDGVIRGVRVCSFTPSQWSAAWVEADYNAWSDPSTFQSYTFDTPTAAVQPIIFAA